MKLVLNANPTLTSRGPWNIAYILTPVPFSCPDPTLGLDAQQRYSTGYIQCMHEVHNMLLTCNWMDKTLGSRLLNHLLKSLPGSTDERAKANSTLRHNVPLLASPAITGTPYRGDPLSGRQLQREGPPCHAAGQQERLELHSSHLGMLDMWRPWWTGGFILAVHCVRPSCVMYLIDMLLRRQTWGGFVPVIIIVGVLYDSIQTFSQYFP